MKYSQGNTKKGTRFKFCTELRGELYCLTSSEQYFSYFQDENKFNNI
jgi:hypothetical protein